MQGDQELPVGEAAGGPVQRCGDLVQPTSPALPPVRRDQHASPAVMEGAGMSVAVAISVPVRPWMPAAVSVSVGVAIL